MSEGTNTNTNPTPNGPEGAKPADQNGTGGTTTPTTFTQDDVNRFVAAERRSVEGRFADYDELKGKAAKLDEAEAANKTELQRAQEAAQAAEKRAADAEGKALRAEVASAKGVPAALLTGSTKEELEAAADALLEFKGAGTPPVPPPAGDGDDPNAPAEQSAKDTVDAAMGRR